MSDWDKLDAKYSSATPTPLKGDEWDALDAKVSKPAASKVAAVADLPKIETPYDPRTRQEPKAPSSPMLRPVSEMGDNLSNMALGAGVGAANIGDTLINGMTYLPGKVTDAIRSMLPAEHKKRVPDISQINRTRGADMDYINGQLADNAPAKAGKFFTEVGATWPVGGAMAKGAQGIMTLPKLAPHAAKAAPLIKAIETGGFQTGRNLDGATKLAKLGDLATRSAGGAITGGTAGALMGGREHAGTGAMVGAALPPALKSVGAAAGYAGKATKSFVQPFTESGQKAIAGSILHRFAQGGPTTLNVAELVPGSLPTLAEASGNAGLAGLQRGARDINPNAFVAREQANASARGALFDDVAGDAGKLDFFKSQRSVNGKELYDKALRVDPSANMTPQIQGEIEALLTRPSIADASKTAKKWAAERGDMQTAQGSMRALHDIKTALDDKLATAVRDGQGGEVAALQATQEKLLGVMERLSPAYKEARITYAEMSKPVNAMESLQSLRLTDARGDMTLSKVKNGIEGLNRARSLAGTHPAKSIEPSQMDQLKALQDDLFRVSNVSLGRSAGSNTFQNIATDNILQSILPGGLGQFAVGKTGSLVGQAGKLLYSGPNEAIRGQVVNMMLDPASAQTALLGQQAIGNQSALTRLLRSQKGQKAQKALHRVAPPLLSDQ